MQLLNSPIEVGVRSLVLLAAVFPRQLDLARLVLLDHYLLHSADLGGPPSVHPPLPSRAGEMGIKRSLIEQGVQVVVRAGLAEVSSTEGGISYRASESSAPFLASLRSEYLDALMDRAQWVAGVSEGLSDDDLRGTVGAVLGRWSEEFDASARGEVER